MLQLLRYAQWGQWRGRVDSVEHRLLFARRSAFVHTCRVTRHLRPYHTFRLERSKSLRLMLRPALACNLRVRFAECRVILADVDAQRRLVQRKPRVAIELRN